jgi:hypothetical protein
MARNLTALNILFALSLASLAGCGGAKGPASSGLDAELQGIATAVAAATSYPADAIEATGSRLRLRLAINDSNLAIADQATRENMARAVVATAEQKLASCQPCAAIESLSVAIIHTSPKDSPGAWHIEDAVEFRRGPHRKFAPHIT